MIQTTDSAVVAGSWEGTVAAYLAELRTDKTRTEYALHLRRFLSLIDDPLAVTPAEVHTFAYAPGLSGRTPSPSTVNVRLAAVRGLYDFLRRMGRIDHNPADNVTRSKLQQPAIRGLSDAEIAALKAAIPDTMAGKRDTAIIRMLLLTGLRRSEVLNLRAGDLSRNGRVYMTIRLKGGRIMRRELPWPVYDGIVKVLEHEGRPLESLGSEDRVWSVGSQGFGLNFARYCRNACRNGGPDHSREHACLRGVSIHTLRHTAAKVRRETGSSLEDVQRLLNHASLATTSRYLARLEGENDEGWAPVAARLEF